MPIVWLEELGGCAAMTLAMHEQGGAGNLTTYLHHFHHSQRRIDPVRETRVR